MDTNDKLRTLYLGKLLFDLTDEEHYLSTEQISALLEEKYKISVHRQTIPRDVEILTKAGMKIETIPGRPNKYHLVERLFENAEIKLLVDAVGSCKSISANMSRKLSAKIASLAGENMAGELKGNIYVEGRVRSGNEKLYRIIDDINFAINDNRKISFHYFRYDENKKKREKNGGKAYILSPYNLTWNGDYYYVVGWSDKHKKITQFRLDRFLSSPNILKERAERKPKDFDLAKKFRTTFHMFDAPCKEVRLICYNDTMDAIIGKFGENVSTYKIDDNHFCATIEVAVSHIFYCWIFGFEGKVKIEGPKDVKNEYRRMIENAL